MKPEFNLSEKIIKEFESYLYLCSVNKNAFWRKQYEEDFKKKIAELSGEHLRC